MSKFDTEGSVGRTLADCVTRFETMSLPHRREPKILLVVPHHDLTRVQREIADRDEQGNVRQSGGILANASDDFYVIHPGQIIAGRRFRSAIIAEEVLYQARREGNIARVEQWINEIVRCRLAPGAPLVYL